jgi:hypothetical protein
MKQKLDKKLSPYMFYFDIAIITIGTGFIVFNVVALIAFRSLPPSILYGSIGGAVLLYQGLRSIKKDYYLLKKHQGRNKKGEGNG